MSTTVSNSKVALWADRLFEVTAWLLLALVPLLINVANVDAYRTIQATYSTVLIAIGVAAWAIARCHEKNWLRVRRVPMLIPLAVFMAWCLLTVPHSPSIPVAMQSFWNLGLYLGYFIALADLTAGSEAMRWRLVTPLLIGFVLNALAGIVQFQHAPVMDWGRPWPQTPFIQNYFAGLDAPAKLGSAAGMLGNQNVLGGYLIGAIPVLLLAGIGGLRSKKRPILSGVMLASSIIGSAALLATQTRGAWIGLLMGLAYAAVALIAYYGAALKRLKPRTWVAIIAAFLVVGGLVTWKGDAIGLHRAIAKIQRAGEDSTSLQRLYAWGVAKTMADESPLVGQGLATFKIHYFQYLVKSFKGAPIPEVMHHRYVQAHNDFIQLAGETGYIGLLIGVVVLFSFIGGITVWIFRRRSLDLSERMLAIGAIAGVVAIAGGAIFGFPYHIATSAFLTVAMAGLAGGLWTADRRATQPDMPQLELYSEGQIAVYNYVLPAAIAIFALALTWTTVTLYDADKHTKLGTELYKAGRMAEAEAELDAALHEDTERGDAHLLMGLVHAINGQFPAGEAELLEAERSYDDVTLHYYLGRIYESMAKPDKARAEYDHAVHYFPADSDIIKAINERRAVLEGTASVAPAATAAAQATTAQPATH